MQESPILTTGQDQSHYRVSTKALIQDSQGRRLLVKEGGVHWDLPGGGIDHGETIEQALRRELREETGTELASFDPRPVFVWPIYVPKFEKHALWVVYDVRITGDPHPTDHTSAVEFIAPADLAYDDMAGYLPRSFFDAFIRRIQ